jgi:hypothetical protein
MSYQRKVGEQFFPETLVFYKQLKFVKYCDVLLGNNLVAVNRALANHGLGTGQCLATAM